MRKTGTKPSACKCKVCKSQCTTTPGLGTPEDIIKIIAAGFADKLAITVWQAGVNMGVMEKPAEIIAPLIDKNTGACSFYQDGLCELHDLGLKPTECRLSHHSIRKTNVDAKKSLSYNVVKEWFSITEEQAQKIKEKYLK